MTNFEKWKDVVLEILRKDDGVMPAVIKGIPVSCDATDCRQCEGSIFYGNDINCSVAFFEWLCKEYVEPIKLTKRQRAFCEAVQTGYLARTKAGELRYSPIKPTRYSTIWIDKEISGRWYSMANYMFPDFPFIKWEDEPYSIEEMLKWEIEDED